MKFLLGACTLALVGMAGCGGSGSATVNPATPATVQTAPGGVATLGFLDIIGSMRPDVLQTNTSAPAAARVGKAAARTATPASSSLPIGVTQSGAGTSDNPYVFTFGGGATAAVSANGGSLTGTIQVIVAASGGTTTYTEAYDLTSTLGTTSCLYTGSLAVAVTTADSSNYTGSLTAPGAGLTVAFTNTANASSNYTYVFVPDLDVSWGPAGFTLSGGYTFTQTGGGAGAVVAVNTTDPIKTDSNFGANFPLMWVTGQSSCSNSYPTSGSLYLTLNPNAASSTTVSETVTAVFGPTAGSLTLNGSQITVGNCN
jgi:hypothetical protein